MKKVIFLGIFAFCLLAIGCKPAENGNAQERFDKLEGQAPELQRSMDVEVLSTPEGSWVNQIAPEYPLRITNSSLGLVMSWEPILDSDVSITGELSHLGAKVYRGMVNFISGDSEKQSQLTLRFDGLGATLSMEFPTFFEDTLVFRPLKESADCSKKVNALVKSLSEYRSLENDNPDLGLMDETEPNAEGIFEFRAFVMQDDGNLQTLGRFKVDLEAGKAFLHDQVEGTYSELKHAEKAIAGLNCK